MKQVIYFLFFILTFGVTFISCKCKKKTIAKKDAIMQNEKQNTLDKVSYKIILDNDHTNIKEKKNLVIKDNDALKAVYAKINMTRRPGLPIPDIDFKEEMIIGICLGEKPHAGYKISIEKVADINNETVVLYRVKSPNGKVATVITQPCLLFSIPKTDLPLKFVNALP